MYWWLINGEYLMVVLFVGLLLLSLPYTIRLVRSKALFLPPAILGYVLVLLIPHALPIPPFAYIAWMLTIPLAWMLYRRRPQLKYWILGSYALVLVGLTSWMMMLLDAM